MPISVAGNDKIEPFINFLTANATKIGVPIDTIYGGRLEDMSYKLSAVSIKDPTKPENSAEYSVPIEMVQDLLNELQPAIQEIREGAMGPLRIPLGKLVAINSTNEPGKAVLLSLRPLPGPNSDTLHSILELITKKLYERRITPPYAMWSQRNPSLNAKRISNIYVISALVKGTNKDAQRGFDTKPIFALEGLDQWGLKRSDHSAEIDLGEISLPGIQLWRGATTVRERRTLETEIMF
ncbi:hypothetical protein BU17DRAFT_78708 [Hysterangium stoloniferum]|nr:hypothetical protein BU17DRAFT_78708 [Hysterangium stoloniferum]